MDSASIIGVGTQSAKSFSRFARLPADLSSHVLPAVRLLHPVRTYEDVPDVMSNLEATNDIVAASALKPRLCPRRPGAVKRP